MEVLQWIAVDELEMVAFGLVDELPAFALELDQPDRETVELMRCLGQRSAAIGDRPDADWFDALLELVLVEFRGEIGCLIGRERARMGVMPHDDFIGATLRSARA